MSVKHSLALMLAIEVLCASADATAKGVVHQVSVARTRVLLADVVARLAPELARIDLGPAPAPGGSRLLTRDEIKRAVEGAHAKAPAVLPAAVRVVRRMQKVTVSDLEQLTRKALDGPALPRGAALAAVHPAGAVNVAAGWDSVRASLPKKPHRAGVLRSTAVLTFAAGADTLATVVVPVELSLTPEAAAWDLPKGGAVKVVVRRGAVEVEAAAVSTANADVGSVFPAVLRSSGRVLRVRLLDKEHAELVEGG